ncbi:hypothetical protein NQ315_014155 [Exocentrus adspersus]|uniref:Uncharacterized protein n=1 Tax=Exocentrus adspersus TaxID=1586481 RepID=A0AAV8VVX0_9CUCU|nr:hypothetical protein NQ315_014155 [Exocentrus adspersus]
MQGGDITTVKRHGGWKSTTVAENYIGESLSSKMAIAEKIQVLPNVGEVVSPSSTSETPHRVNLNPGQNNKVVFELNVNFYWGKALERSLKQNKGLFGNWRFIIAPHQSTI